MKLTLYSEEMPKREHDILLVLGDGRSLPKDMGEFLAWGIDHDVAALGRGIKLYPGKVHHWMNADGAMSINWAKNLENGEGTIRHTFGKMDGFDVDWEIEQDDYHYTDITHEKTTRNHGSSSLFATLAGLEMGYRKVVLAGCPLDTEGHWMWDPYVDGKLVDERLGPVWMCFDFMAWLDFREGPDAGKVRSMSGYTAKMLGLADKRWANAL